MLAFFRRIIGSWVVVALLGVIMLAFVFTGATTGGLNLTGGPGSEAVASVDGHNVPSQDVARRAQAQLAQARQQQPGLDMPTMLRAGGGIDALVDGYVTGQALQAWAERHGLTASDKLIDGEIAGIPAFQGPTGRFDDAQMRAVLSQQRMNEADLRRGLREDLIRRQLLAPLGVGAKMPATIATAYAGLFIARREGLVGVVPADPATVPPPGEAEVAAWYKAHVAAYSLPERRIVRYAPISPATVTVAPPSEAEIAARYQAQASDFAAKETRSFSQVVLPVEAAARALTAKVAGGAAFAKAAAEAGFAPGDIALGTVAKADLGRNATPAIAEAAYAAKSGATIGPLKSALGWHVLHVDAVTKVAAKPLAEARAAITDELLKQRRIEAVSKLGQKIQDAVDDGSTFDEVARANGLAVTTTPPVIASGTAPGDPAFRPEPALLALLKPAFSGAPEDQPTLEQVGPDQQFALLSLASIVPAAPIPLAQVHDRVIADLRADRAATRARAVAQSVLDKVKAGQPLAAALAAAKLAPPQTVGATRLELSQSQQVPPAMRALFALAPGRAALAPAPGGWMIVQLARIVPGSPQIQQGVAAGLRSQMSNALGSELLEQFARAAQADVKVKRNPAAIAALARELAGQAPAQAGQ